MLATQSAPSLVLSEMEASLLSLPFQGQAVQLHWQLQADRSRMQVGLSFSNPSPWLAAPPGSAGLPCPVSTLHPQRVLHHLQGWGGQPAHDPAPQLGEQQVRLWQRPDCHDGPLHRLHLWGLARVSVPCTSATLAMSSFISKEKIQRQSTVFPFLSI